MRTATAADLEAELGQLLTASNRLAKQLVKGADELARNVERIGELHRQSIAARHDERIFKGEVEKLLKKPDLTTKSTKDTK